MFLQWTLIKRGSTLSHHVLNDGKLFVVTIYKDVLQAAGVKNLKQKLFEKEPKFNISFVKQYNNVAYKVLPEFLGLNWFLQTGSQERIYNYNYVVFCI